MNRKEALAASVVIALALNLAHRCAVPVHAAQANQNKRVLIVNPIDETKLITLQGNTRPEANAANDRGRVDDGFRMEHLLLQLKRAPEQEEAFEKYSDELSDKSSPNYHRWLTPAEIGEMYGPAQADVETVRAWLESHGFKVAPAPPNGMALDFSGTAGEIRDTFHTEIHYLDVRGKTHFANMSDPSIPAALAPVVVGVVSMHNFMPQSMVVPRTN
jgi:Pro-kumamolisin, activation domain